MSNCQYSHFVAQIVKFRGEMHEFHYFKKQETQKVTEIEFKNTNHVTNFVTFRICDKVWRWWSKNNHLKYIYGISRENLLLRTVFQSNSLVNRFSPCMSFPLFLCGKYWKLPWNELKENNIRVNVLSLSLSRSVSHTWPSCGSQYWFFQSSAVLSGLSSEFSLDLWLAYH